MHDIQSKYTGPDIQSIYRGADIQSITRSDIQSITRMDIKSMTRADIQSVYKDDSGIQEIVALAGAFSSCQVSDDWKKDKMEALIEKEL